jgi:hypothetical protein
MIPFWVIGVTAAAFRRTPEQKRQALAEQALRRKLYTVPRADRGAWEARYRLDMDALANEQERINRQAQEAFNRQHPFTMIYFPRLVLGTMVAAFLLLVISFAMEDERDAQAARVPEPAVTYDAPSPSYNNQ